MIKTIMLRLITVVMLILCIMLCGCGGRGGDTAVSSSPPQTNTSIKQDITSNPAVYFEDEAAYWAATHVLFADCRSVELEEADGEKNIIFTFCPFKIFKGECELLDDDNVIYRNITVKESAEKYSLDNVYSVGNSYLLYLKKTEPTDLDEEASYTDVFCYDRCIQLEERHQLTQDYEYYDMISLLNDRRIRQIQYSQEQFD